MSFNRKDEDVVNPLHPQSLSPTQCGNPELMGQWRGDTEWHGFPKVHVIYRRNAGPGEYRVEIICPGSHTFEEA